MGEGLSEHVCVYWGNASERPVSPMASEQENISILDGTQPEWPTGRRGEPSFPPPYESCCSACARSEKAASKEAA